MRFDYFNLSSELIAYEVPDPVNQGQTVRCGTSASVTIHLLPCMVSSQCYKGAGSFSIGTAEKETPVILEICADISHDARDETSKRRADDAIKTLTQHPERIHPALRFLNQRSEWWAVGHYSGETYCYGITHNDTTLQAQNVSIPHLIFLEELMRTVSAWLADLYKSLSSWVSRGPAVS